METISKCPVCDSLNMGPYLNCKDYTVSKEVFQITRCNDCSFLFTNPRPIQAEIGKYYQSEDYISHSNTKKGIFNKLYQYIRNITIDQKLSVISHYVSRGTLLDIGCGTGEFLNYCNSKGWETIGIEPGTEARNNAIKNYSLAVHEESYINTIENDSFDVITLWHVLEHVHELNNRVGELARIIKDNGILIIAVPNHTSYDANKYKEFWAAYDLPRHLYHFSPKTITQLFKKNQLDLIKILPMKFDSYYVSMLSEKYKTGKLNYLKAAAMGLLSNMNAGRRNTNSYSSQIYIFKKKTGNNIP